MALTGNGIELLVKLGVNSGESKANLNAQIAQIQKQLNDVKIDIKIDPQAIKSLNTLANMDFSKLVKSANEVKTAMDGMSGKGKKPLEEVNKEARKLAEVAPTIKNAFESVGSNLQKSMSKGITTIEELKRAFKGMDATFSYGKEIITSDQQMTAEKRINGITVAFRNAQGAMERMKLSNKEFIDMGNGQTKPIFQPIGDSRVIDNSISQINKLSQTAQAQLTKMRSEGKLTAQQFTELSAAIGKANSTQDGKVAANNFALLNQRIQESVQSTRQLNEAQRATEATQRRLIDNENKRKNLIIDIERQLRTQGKGFDAEGARRLLAQTQALNVSSAQFTQNLAANRTQLRQYSADAASASNSNIGIMESMRVAFERFPIWMAASTMFYGTIRTAREFGSIIVDIDGKMIGLQKVMSEDTDFEGLFDSATQSAERFGQSISSVLESFNEFAKQGYKGDELAGLADAGLVASNVGDITAQKASEYMTATLIQWKKDSSEAMGIIDSLNEVSNNYATTTEKVFQGLSKSSATAKAMNLDFDQTVAVIGTLTAATKQSGNEIGNFLKSTLPRLISKPGQSALKSLGIELMDESGNLKDVVGVYEQVAQKIKGISESERIAVVEGLAGKLYCPFA